MANNSKNSQNNTNSKASSRGSTPKTGGARAPPSEAYKVQHVPSQPPATNAWTSGRNASSVKAAPAKAQTGTPSAQEKASGAAGTTPSRNESRATTREHVPVHGFNAAEVADYMKRGAGGEVINESKPSPKAEGSTAAAKRTGGGTSAKPTQMANGQDFWVQLTKQIAQLEQGRGG